MGVRVPPSAPLDSALRASLVAGLTQGRVEWCPERAAKPRVEGHPNISEPRLIDATRRWHRRLMWVYILRCSDDSLYVGVTSDLATRVEQHQVGFAASYTARRRPVALVYSEEIDRSADAIARERQLKRWSAMKKRALIQGDPETLRRLAKRRRPKRKRADRSVSFG